MTELQKDCAYAALIFLATVGFTMLFFEIVIYMIRWYIK